MAYRRDPPGTISKEKLNQVLEFPGIGHKMTIYMNVYHNVPVSHAYFYENLAASLQALANQVVTKAAGLRKMEGLRKEEVEEPTLTEEMPPKGFPL